MKDTTGPGWRRVMLPLRVSAAITETGALLFFSTASEWELRMGLRATHRPYTLRTCPRFDRDASRRVARGGKSRFSNFGTHNKTAEPPADSRPPTEPRVDPGAPMLYRQHAPGNGVRRRVAVGMRSCLARAEVSPAKSQKLPARALRRTCAPYGRDRDSDPIARCLSLRRQRGVYWNAPPPLRVHTPPEQAQLVRHFLLVVAAVSRDKPDEVCMPP